jgi:hypothetical protein
VPATYIDNHIQRLQMYRVECAVDYCVETLDVGVAHVEQLDDEIPAHGWRGSDLEDGWICPDPDHANR